MKSTCTEYIEDPFVCHDGGEPKGQCLNCGDKWFNHELEVLPPEEREGTEAIYWYQLSRKYQIT